MTKAEKYKCNVIAYIAMYIRDNVANDKSKIDDLRCYDIVYDIACELADEFIGGEFDYENESLFDCIDAFMNQESMIDYFHDYM